MFIPISKSWLDEISGGTQGFMKIAKEEINGLIHDKVKLVLPRADCGSLNIKGSKYQKCFIFLFPPLNILQTLYKLFIYKC